MPEAITPGSTFAGYEIEAIAGRGGMGVVYRARQLRPSRRVALKVITPDLAQDEAFRRRFERESEIAAAIEHPNVVPVYEVGDVDGALFITTRFVEGTDLRALLREQRALDPRLAANLVAQVARALDAAHERGLVHRDVKPANVLIAGQPGSYHAYLTDFGLTKSASAESGMTETGVFVGTLDYIAPEQLAGGPLDARADVYALGCVLYQMLTGQVPYPRDTAIAVMYAHGSEPPPSATAVRPDLPPQFDDVVKRAMAKDPNARYPSAGDLGRAAEAAAQSQRMTGAERTVATGDAAPRTATTRVVQPPAPPPSPGSPPPPAAAPPATPPGPSPHPPRPRRRIGVVAAAIAAVALLAVLAVALLGGGDGGEQEPLSKAEYEDQAIAAISGVDQQAIDSVPADLPEDPAERATLLQTQDKLVTALNAAADKFSHLKPPADTQAVHDRASDALWEFANIFGERKTATEQNDGTAYKDATDRLNTVNEKFNELTAEYARLGYKRLGEATTP